MDKITICHAAGRLGTTKYVEITESRNASYEIWTNTVPRRRATRRTTTPFPASPVAPHHSGSGKISCSFNWGLSTPAVGVVNGVGAWSGVGGTGSFVVPIDLTRGGLACGSRTLTNTAILQASNGGTYTATASVVVNFGTLVGKCP
jgi:hypothetical protein